MNVEFKLTTLSALRDLGGNATQERDLTPEEVWDLQHSWELYRRYLSEDAKTVEMLDRTYGHQHSALINSLRRGHAGGSGMRLRIWADAISTTI